MRPEDDHAIPAEPSQVSGGDCTLPDNLGATMIEAYEGAIAAATDVIEAIAGKS